MSTIPPFGTHVASETTFPANDRTWLAEQRAAQQQEQRAEDELRHYEVLGAGMAVFCVSFWEALRGAEPETDVRFSRDDMLRLLEAALRGR